MKVVLINGSPHKNGCTYTALEEVARSLSVAVRFTLPEVTAMFTLASLVKSAKVAPAIKVRQSTIDNTDERIIFFFMIIISYVDEG